jgi:hypothetical protein
VETGIFSRFEQISGGCFAFFNSNCLKDNKILSVFFLTQES